MSFRLGLTGSIGMGKSTTAAVFAVEGVPVWDADSAVHRLYEPGMAGAEAVGRLAPPAIDAEGRVDRARLRGLIQADPALLDRVTAAVHPLVADDRTAFLVATADASIVLLDIPLLYETGLQDLCDAVAVASAPAEVQRQRVLARGITDDGFQLILSRQLPDAEKRARADYVIPTVDLDTTRAAVRQVLADISRRIAEHA